MLVHLESPDVTGDTVRFRWSQSHTNLFQAQETFFFRYEGLDLAAVSLELLYEVFLGLQLRVFAGYDCPVEITLLAPVPRSTVDFWKAFHRADAVTVNPIAETVSYRPLASQPESPGARFAVFFGGGKDSVLAACLLSELSGPADVALIQFVGPLRDDQRLFSRLERRQEALMLEPARSVLGVSTRRVWTDYQAQFRPEGYGRRPGLELYTVGALPLLVSLGVSLCTFCIGWNTFSITATGDGQIYRYANARPEVLATQSAHYRIALGSELNVTNLGYPFAHMSAFALLAERYPRALRQIIMCTHVTGEHERWCYDCRKCAEYACYSVICDAIDPRFDYEHFFGRSAYFESLVAYAESGVELTKFGNAPWVRFMSMKRGYLRTCHTFALLDPEALRSRLSPQAMGNLLLAKAIFGNTLFPGTDVVPEQTIDALPARIREPIRTIVAEHFDLVTEVPGPFTAGNQQVVYDFDPVLPTPIANVPHLRADCVGIEL